MKISNKIVWILLIGIAPTYLITAEDAPFDAASKKAVVAEVMEKLNEHYVFPDKATLMIEKLQQQMDSGAYDAMGEPAAFAAQLTKDLRSVYPDLHLSVTHLSGPMGPGNRPDPEARRERLRRENFNFRKAEWLPGNIGYLRLDGFMSAGMAGKTAEAALAFLAHTDALIIDLRQNGGGSPTMVALLYSYFFEDSVHFNDFYTRKGNEIQQFWTSEHVSGQKMPDVPIYVLTSKRTFSAGEGFSYHLKHLERATIVGETTRGGAHPTQRMPLKDERFFISIPFGRAINPVTGGNWEGTGVQPDIPVPADQALDKAHLLALRDLADKEQDTNRQKELTWHIDAIGVRLNPIEVDETTLQTYVGQYGPREIFFVDGRLVYRRGQGPELHLHPIRKDLFGIDGYEGFRIEFVRGPDGAVTGAKGLYASGNNDIFDKNPG